LYKSYWTTEKVFHILPHWNWEGKEGNTIPVFCYTNYDSVELFVNNKSYGMERFDTNSLLGLYRLMWMDVRYEPGELKAIAYKEGKIVDEKITKTAGAPQQLNLIQYKDKITMNGDDLAFITVEVLDEKGNLCPNANNLITFEGEGGIIEAVGNGDPTSLESFKDSKRKAFSGKCMVIVRPEKGVSEIKVKANSDKLKGKEVKIVSF
jgi:beta-galactosidase